MGRRLWSTTVRYFERSVRHEAAIVRSAASGGVSGASFRPEVDIRTTVAARGKGATVKSDSLVKVLLHSGGGLPSGFTGIDGVSPASLLFGGSCYAVFAVAAADRLGLESPS